MLPAHLSSTHHVDGVDICYAAECPQAVKQAADGRWFITIDHPGFNSPANNRNGYATKGHAVRAMCRYAGSRR